MGSRVSLLLPLLWAALLLWVAAAAHAAITRTALDDYVERPDPTYKWTLNDTVVTAEYTVYWIHLVSQTWLTPADSSKPVWDHWLSILVPFGATSDNCFVYITGDGNRDKHEDVDPLSQIIGVQANSVVAELYQIPNEPIYFADNKRRTEDAIIAYTWRHFIENPDEPDWLLRLPMTKAVVRAMDAVQEFSRQHSNVPDINHFVVGGASKRGWTTWTVGAVEYDKRVIAIVPIVMDALNLVKNVNHMWQAYGFWSFAWEDYEAENITVYLNDPRFQQMADIIDPYSYRERLTMPKYVIDAAGDEFFLPDDANYWWDDMPGPKHMRMVADAEHSLVGHQIDVSLAVTTFYRSIMLKKPIPTFDWTRDPETGKIVVTMGDKKPYQVLKWHATNHKARDFRLVICDKVDPKCLQPIIWTYNALTPQADGTYVAEMEAPQQGFTGFFVEVIFLADDLGMAGEHFFKFTTQVSIIPNILPFPPCGNPCVGGLQKPMEQ